MNVVNYFLSFIFLCCSIPAFAYDPCRDLQILWQMDDNSQAIPPITVSNGSTADYFDITLPGLPSTAPGSVSWIQRYNVPFGTNNIASGNGSKNLATWIALPAGGGDISLGDGLTGRIEIISGNYLVRGIYSGFQTYSGPYKFPNWVGNFPSSLNVGSRYPLVENSFTETKLRVYITKGSAFSGTYNVRIPIKIGAEEWYKGEKYCSGGGGVELAVASMQNRFAPVQVNVMASCSLTGGSNIAINHGKITTAQARSGHSSSTNFGINCGSPSNVQLTFEGVQPVSGEARNVTKCGNNGKCTLTVDDNASFVGVVDGSKNFKISSVYQTVGSSTPDSGAFSGNAILRVLMQ
ncbi:hypothetical protein [Winslowiella toletana]|uniref:hypothetical protein n=1 Tax=Winslowiella toletana TaxID=92490 RepID=UPI0028BF0560|nr:hypothetical protein [Winslowiella toletana]WNN44047.1 hypothetical protein RIN69_20705 [Winslowiella toletana]